MAYETNYLKMDQVKFVNGLQRQTISIQIFERVSSTNFTWSILGYFAPYMKLFSSQNISPHYVLHVTNICVKRKNTQSKP